MISLGREPATEKNRFFYSRYRKYKIWTFICHKIWSRSECTKRLKIRYKKTSISKIYTRGPDFRFRVIRELSQAAGSLCPFSSLYSNFTLAGYRPKISANANSLLKFACDYLHNRVYVNIFEMDLSHCVFRIQVVRISTLSSHGDFESKLLWEILQTF